MKYSYEAWFISAMVGGVIIGFLLGLFIGVLFA